MGAPGRAVLGKESSHRNQIAARGVNAALPPALPLSRLKAHGRHSPPAHGVLLQPSPGRPTNDTQSRECPDRQLRRTGGPPAARRRDLGDRRLPRGSSAPSQRGALPAPPLPFSYRAATICRTSAPSRPLPNRHIANRNAPVAPPPPRGPLPPQHPPNCTPRRRSPTHPYGAQPRWRRKDEAARCPPGCAPPRPPAAGCSRHSLSAQSASGPSGVRAPTAVSFAVPRSVPACPSCSGRRFGDRSRRALRAGTHWDSPARPPGAAVAMETESR